MLSRWSRKICDYSIGQAVGVSLFAVGLFSLTYHICPSRSIFQSDTNDMFLCGTMVIVAVFHGWSWSPEDKRVESKQSMPLLAHQIDLKCKKRKPFRASAVFVSFLCPLIILNYVGSIIDVEDTNSLSMMPAVLRKNLKVIRGLTGVAFLIWFLLIVAWGRWKNRVFFEEAFNKKKLKIEQAQKEVGETEGSNHLCQGIIRKLKLQIQQIGRASCRERV